MKKLYLLVLFTFIAYKGFTQASSCAQTLRLAQSIYDQGRLHELEDIINKQLDKGDCVKADQVSLQKLLTLAYIYLEEPEKADASMLKLLETDHYFAINPAVDPAEFVALFNTFRTTPIFRLGLKFGNNLTQINVSSFNPVSDGSTKYGLLTGIGGGFIAELPISKKLKISGELLFQQKKFSSKSVSTFTENTQSGNNSFDYSSSSGIEVQNWISLPILAQYELIQDRKIIPFIEGGVSTDLSLGSKKNVERKRVGNQPIDSKSYSLNAQREQLNISGVIGAGVRTRIASGFLLAGVRYSHGLTKANSISTMYDNPLLSFDYALNDGIFSMNSMYFNVGFVQNFFKPQKIKSKK